MDATDDRSEGLLAWQWKHYDEAHQTRRNLVIHAFTNPMFIFGWASLLGQLFVHPIAAPFSLIPIVLAVFLQGRGHKGEPNAPLPFRGPLDVVARLFVEQWVTFPRFVLSGGFAKSWRENRAK